MRKLRFVVALYFYQSSWAADYNGPHFDAYLHYNEEAYSGKSAPRPFKNVLQRMQWNGVRGILPNSWPKASSLALATSSLTAQAGITVVPFLRLYRYRADYSAWFADPTIETMIHIELAQGNNAALTKA